jgi:hypothetical protein
MSMSKGANLADDRRWLSAASFWNPSHVVTSAWLEHGPFGFWIIDALRPRVVVELGTHSGYSYFVFCEAVKRLGLDTRCFALDTWAGDDHAGFYGEDIYAMVSAVNDEHYADFSQLIRGYFDDGLASVDDGSVDLLHIDGRHGYEDVKHDFESWRPKLSDRAVVLFHDIAERENGFGVWRLWEELSGTDSSFTFHHGHGLGVLAAGAAVPTAITDFLAAAAPAGDRVRAEYQRLGRVIVQREADETEREVLRSTYYTTLAQLERTQADLATASERLSQLERYARFGRLVPRWVKRALAR